MNLLRHFKARETKTVECAIIGTGSFGRSFLTHSRNIQGLRCRVAVDLDSKTAAAALAKSGISTDEIVECADADQAVIAWKNGQAIAVSDFALVADLPFDVVLEATGHPEAGARHTRLAIEADKHVVLITKETDSVVGPVLAKLAAERGKVVSPVDGDQPSLLIGLITWAQVVGLTVVAAGKSSEYDFVFDPETGTITSNGRTVDAPGFGDWIHPRGRPWQDIVDARSAHASELPQRTVPDLCEMTVVANHLDLVADRADFHAPIARPSEVADLMAPKPDGGLFDHTDLRLDIFHCLRLPTEQSFAGGVFVTVKCEDQESWDILAEKGHIVSQNGKTAMIGLPRHLLGLEAATTVFECALFGHSSGGEMPKPTVDLTAFADQDVKAGTILHAVGHHHSIANVSGRMTPAMALGDRTPIPYYLAAGRRLRNDVRAGQPIYCADVELDEQSELVRLRRLQDETMLAR